YMGFGLNFAGGDVGYRGEKFALRLDLRWGTAVPLLTPIAPLKQGYVSWLPLERLTLDFGFFDTTFGAEFVDEWTNANYTRGALYFLRQPFNHLGIRLGATLSDKLTLRFMVTQGNVLGGTPVAFNEVPAIGWQLSVTPSDLVRFLIGGNHGPNGDNGNKDWESFLDLILELDIRWLTVILNGSYIVNPHGVDPVTGATEQMVFAYGGSLELIFDASDHWSIGLRAEHLSGNQNYREFGDPKGDSYRFLWTTTLTVRYKPVEYLVFSLEGRVEGAGTDIYYSRSSPTVLDPETMQELTQPNRNKYYGAILGVTAHIGN
ncbi:MAG: outer membrane beta-barrel protein, partial [Polyangiales bacterium]